MDGGDRQFIRSRADETDRVRLWPALSSERGKLPIGLSGGSETAAMPMDKRAIVVRRVDAFDSVLNGSN